MTVIQFDGRQQRKLSPSSDSEVSAVRHSTSTPPTELISNDWLLALHIPLFSDDIFVEYTRARLLQSTDFHNIILPSTVDRTLVQRAFLALATTFFGVEHKEKQLVSQGFHRYGDALKHVRQALSGPACYVSFDLLESIVVMSLFEFLISENENGWLSHAVGLERLMSLRGPDSFKTYPEIVMLQNSRLSIIIASVLLRRRTIFSAPEWKSIPWSLHPEAKNAMQLLMDILADCPDLFIEKEQIMSDAGTDNHVIEWRKLRAKVKLVLDRLAEWERDWEANNSGYCSEVPAPSTTPTLIDYRGISVPAWNTVLEYNSLYHANTVVVYNAILILVQILGHKIAFSGNVPALHSQNVASFPDRTFSASLVICRSVEYHLQSLRKGAGSFFLLFPLRMAYDAIGQSNPVIGAWLHDVLQKIQDGKSGRWATAKYLLNIQPQTTLSQPACII
ncbi:hypothetical protein V1509DRAFT_638497 [Lipomyces kononenkoae]